VLVVVGMAVAPDAELCVCFTLPGFVARLLQMRCDTRRLWFPACFGDGKGHRKNGSGGWVTREIAGLSSAHAPESRV
jgi:hypothetical protein